MVKPKVNKLVEQSNNNRDIMNEAKELLLNESEVELDMGAGLQIIEPSEEAKSVDKSKMGSGKRGKELKAKNSLYRNYEVMSEDEISEVVEILNSPRRRNNQRKRSARRSILAKNRLNVDDSTN